MPRTRRRAHSRRETRAESVEAARSRLGSLPLARKGLLAVELYPVKTYRAIEDAAKSCSGAITRD